MNTLRYRVYTNHVPLPGLFLLPAAQEMSVRMQQFFPSVRTYFRCERATV
ncbi:hypothetical protein [Azospirillum sp. TSO5]|nr:hypothetical protein [Azospirillum sp. TSO5]